MRRPATPLGISEGGEGRSSSSEEERSGWCEVVVEESKVEERWDKEQVSKERQERGLCGVRGGEEVRSLQGLINEDEEGGDEDEGEEEEG